MSKRYLIDTHILIWYLDGNPILSTKVKDELNNPAIKVFVSTVSLWELAIKLSKQKIDIKITLQQIEEDIAKRDFELLDISFRHLNTLLLLPVIHSDPFDRMLISQAVSENLVLISVDRYFESYLVEILC